MREEDRKREYFMILFCNQYLLIITELITILPSPPLNTLRLHYVSTSFAKNLLLFSSSSFSSRFSALFFKLFSPAPDCKEARVRSFRSRECLCSMVPPVRPKTRTFLLCPRHRASILSPSRTSSPRSYRGLK